MNNYTPKPNTGTLFKNTKKTDPKHPDMTGTYLNEQGIMRRIAAWTKAGKNGKFLSIVLSDMDQPRTTSTPAPQTGSEDDLPF
jgi:hypothetical protein